MPEKNFEQQAREMANGFNMEPKPEIWNNVHRAIQQPERKRRFVLWWWLLPIALVSGLVAVYTLSGQNKASEKLTASAVKQRTDDKNPPIANTLAPKKDNLKSNVKEEKSNSLTIQTKSKSIDIKSSLATKTFNSTAEKKQTSNQVLDGSATSIDVVSEQTIVADKTLKQDNKALSALPLVNNEDKRSNANIDADSLQTSVSKDSFSLELSVKDAVLPATTTQQNAANVTKTKKPKALQWGLIAEAGIAARKSSVFSLVNTDKSLNSRPAPQSMSDGLSGYWGLANNSTSFSFDNNIKHGKAFSFGVALKNKINRSTDVFADLTYGYQSYKMTSTAYKDSLLLNYALTTRIGSYQSTQSFNFASVFTGINWHFINSKKLQLGVSAGVDNLLLLAANQKINSVSNSSFDFSVPRMQGLSDSFFTKANFYKYQPSLFAGVIVNIYTGKQEWQIVPFVRSSIRPFDKTTTSRNNHLFSAGVRAIYFFK